MTQPFVWNYARLMKLLRLHKCGYSTRQIADRLETSRETVRTKLLSLSLNENEAPVLGQRVKPITRVVRPPPTAKPAKLSPVTFPRFEDHPDADKDRFRGRKPQPQSAYSQIGCSALMCVGG